MKLPPIKKMLWQYCRKNPTRLHMPAHKGKLGQCTDIDITELHFTDNLKNPSGAIEKSQQLYAKEIGAKYCHYLVNGSSVGLFAMAFCAGKKSLVEDCCHISLLNGLNLANKQYTKISCDVKNGVPVPLTLDKIAKAISDQPDIDTVFVTSPNYVGDVAELENIYKFLKSKRILLFVDSAHGSHFGLSPLLPKNAVEFCDATVESTHKTLGSLTQTAVLLTNNKSLYTELKTHLNVFTTTSPSFVLLQSIEGAIVYAASHKEDYQRLFDDINIFGEKLKTIGFSLKQSDDFSRVVVDCGELDGRVLYAELCKHNVYCEYATERYIVAILSIFDNAETLNAFFQALKNSDPKASKKYNQYIDECFNKDKASKKQRKQ